MGCVVRRGTKGLDEVDEGARRLLAHCSSCLTLIT